MTMMIKDTFHVRQGDMTTAGDASARIKRQLKQLGIPASVVRRVSVGTYEAEINLVIHSDGGTLTLKVDDEGVHLKSQDVGPGIADIDQAMREGYSTADEEARSLGFGAGMGLPNMKRNADRFAIKSRLGEGTTIDMMFALA